MPTFKKINFGDGLTVTDQGGGEITVAGGGLVGPAGPEGPQGDPGPQGPAGEGVPAGGTAGQVLTKDTTTDYDTSWQTPAAAGTPGMVKIGEVVLASVAANIDFQSIPQTYSSLRLVASLRGDAAAVNVGAQLRLNNDAGGNYQNERVRGIGTGVSAIENTGFTGIAFDILGGNAGTWRSPFVIDLPDYTDAAGPQAALFSGGSATQLAPGGYMVTHGLAYWVGSAAVNRITILPSSGSFAAGSRAALYGLT